MVDLVYNPLDKEEDNIKELLIANGYDRSFFNEGFIKIIEIDPKKEYNSNATVKLSFTGKAKSIFGVDTRTHEFNKLPDPAKNKMIYADTVKRGKDVPEIHGKLIDLYKRTQYGVYCREDEDIKTVQISGNIDRCFGTISMDVKPGPYLDKTSATRMEKSMVVGRKVESIFDQPYNLVSLCLFDNFRGQLKPDEVLRPIEVFTNKFVFFFDCFSNKPLIISERIMELKVRDIYNRQIVDEHIFSREKKLYTLASENKEKGTVFKKLDFGDTVIDADTLKLKDFTSSVLYLSTPHRVNVEVVRYDRAWARIFQSALSVSGKNNVIAVLSLNDRDSKRFPNNIKVENKIGTNSEIKTVFETGLSYKDNDEDMILRKIKSYLSSLLVSALVTIEEPTVLLKPGTDDEKIRTYKVVLSDMISKDILLVDNSVKPEIEFIVKNTDVPVLPYKINGFKQVK